MLKLWIPMSALLYVIGLSLKNDPTSFALLLEGVE